jgi:hypothetical protein
LCFLGALQDPAGKVQLLAQAFMGAQVCAYTSMRTPKTDLRRRPQVTPDTVTA